MRYSLGVSHLIPVKDIMCGVGGTSSSILSRFIVLAFLAQCCGDSRLIGKSGIYNAFFMYISWWLPLSSCILHLRLPINFTCRSSLVSFPLVFFAGLRSVM